MGPLENKVAIVSGAGRGIGRAIALKLASAGASVLVNDLDETAASETVSEIASRGGSANACPGSVSHPEFPARFVETALNRFSRLDIIVNNAGFTWDNVIQKMSDEQWYAVIDVHLTAPFRIMRAAADYFRTQARAEAQRGEEVYRKVVNISSIAGLGGNPGQANYAAAKAGVVGLTKTMAKEWGRYKVNVNAVAFGLISTRLTEPTTSASTIDIEGRTISVGVNATLLAELERTIPLGRRGTPDDAAGAVYMLCHPDSNYITGEIMVCAGGVSL